MNCNKCGAFNNPGSTTCHNCGNPLAQNAPVNIFNQPMTQNNIAGSQPAQSNMMNQNIQPQQPMVNQPFGQSQSIIQSQTGYTQSVQPQQPMVNQPSSQVETTSEKKKKPTIIIIIILLLVVGAVVFFLLKGKDGSGIGGGKRGSKNALGKAYAPEHPYEVYFDTSAPVPFYHNGKRGFATRDGKVIVPAKYDIIESQFNGDIAIVQTKTGTFDYDHYVINKSGKELKKYSSSSGADYDIAYGVYKIENELYDSNYKKLSGEHSIQYFANGYSIWNDSVNLKAGLMDPTGKTVVSFDYKPDESTILDVWKYDIKLNNMYCLIGHNKIYNCSTGKLIKDFDKKYNDSYAFGGNIFLLRKGSDRQYVYVEDDKIVLTSNKDMEYKNYYIKYYDDESGKNSYYNIISKKKVSSERDIPNLFGAKKEYEKVKCDNGNYKIIKDGKEIISCNWYSYEDLSEEFGSYLYSLGKEYIIGSMYNDASALIDLKTGKVVKEFSFKVTNKTREPTIFLQGNDYKNKKLYVYNVLTGDEQYFTNPKTKINYKSTYLYVNINKPDYVDYTYTDKFKLINKDL